MESKGKGKREREMAEKNDQLKEIQMLEGHTSKVWSVAWNPASGTDGKPAILASCGADKTIRIWKQNPDTSSFVCVVPPLSLSLSPSLSLSLSVFMIYIKLASPEIIHTHYDVGFREM